MAESCDYFIFFHSQNKIDHIVAFSFVRFLYKKNREKILSIDLLCSVRNTKRFGQMLAFALYKFAISNKCSFIYASPRDSKLKETFLNYGFYEIHSVNKITVLEKEVLSEFKIKANRSCTRKQKTYSLKSKGRLFYNKSQLPIELE